MAFGFDRLVAIVVFLGAALMLSRPRFGGVAAGVAVAGSMFVVSVFEALGDGHPGGQGAVVAQAVRFVAPAVLAYWVADGRADRGCRALAWAVVAVFAAHGVECLIGHPRFIDFLIVLPNRYLGWSVQQSAAQRWLLVIGAVDLAVAVGFALTRHRALAAWMAGWGLLTATVRLLYWGPVGWADALVRIGNGSVPMMLAWWPLGAHEEESKHV